MQSVRWIGLFLLLTTGIGLSQNPGRLHGKSKGKGVLTGTVVDAETQVPLEYASVLVYRLTDSTKVTGAVTDQDGQFVIPGLHPGRYYVTVDFIGYRQEVLSPVLMKPSLPRLDLGTIALKPAVLQTSPVEVKAEAPPIAYKIDKKVVYVSQQATAASGTAVDVLENVPSVEVDIEGNVKLRGSGNFTLLINGRPTVLDPSEVLQQIPASMIDRIEIITNPSAKYDPEGIAGILNVILKKKGPRGIAGTLSLNAGLDQKYGGSILLSRRTRNANVYLSLHYNHRYYPGSYSGSYLYEVPMLFSIQREMEGSFAHQMLPAGLRAGLDFRLSPKDFLSVGGSYGRWQMERNSTVHYVEVGIPPDPPFPETTRYITENTWKRSGPYTSGFLSYEHDFAGQEHKATLDFSYSKRSGNEESQSFQFDDTTGGILSGNLATEEGPSERGDLKLHYQRPILTSSKLELGYQGSLRRSQTLKSYAIWDTASGEFVFQPEFQHDVQTSHLHHAIYGLLSNETGRLGWQVGLRIERIHRTIQLKEVGETFKLDQMDYFPSFHISYKLAERTQVMAGYTRRIRRPRSWWLEPYLTWIDANTVYQGNPDLQPSFSDAVDLGFQTPMGPLDVTIDAYARFTHQRIERIQRIYEGDVVLFTYDNVGSSESYGSEINIDWKPLPFWSLNGVLDLSEFRLYGTSYRGSFQWNLRLRSDFRLGRATQIQVTARYTSPSVTSQGTREGYYTLDLAWRQNFSRSLSLILQVRDVFRTGKWSFTSSFENRTIERTYQRKAPVITISLRYLFNTYRPEKRPQIPSTEEEQPPDIFEGF